MYFKSDRFTVQHCMTVFLYYMEFNLIGLTVPTVFMSPPKESIHSQNRVPRETAPAGNGRDTGKIQHAREVPSFEKCRDTAYPEKAVLILLNLPSNLTK